MNIKVYELYIHCQSNLNSECLRLKDINKQDPKKF